MDERRVIDLLGVDGAGNLYSVIQDYQRTMTFLEGRLDEETSHRVAVEILKSPEYRRGYPFQTAGQVMSGPRKCVAFICERRKTDCQD